MDIERSTRFLGERRRRTRESRRFGPRIADRGPHVRLTATTIQSFTVHLAYAVSEPRCGAAVSAGACLAS